MRPAKKVASVLDKIFNGSLIVTFTFSGVLIIFMMLVMTGHVLGRYFFTYPIPWAVEFSEYFLAIIVLMGAAWVLKEEAHVCIDIFVNVLARRPRSIVNSVTTWITAATLLFLTYWGALVTYQHAVTGQVLWKTVLTPIWILDIFMPIATFLLFIQSVKRALGYWRAATKTTSEERK